MEIIPSILESTFDGFISKLRAVEPYFPYIQVDVMDGKFVDNTSFPEVAKAKNIDTQLKFELHLMVQDPVSEIEKWKGDNKVFRVLFPIEDGDPTETIKLIREQGWQAGLVLNADTPLSAVEPYFPLVDLILFMTVYPGKQGRPFVEKVKEKIKMFTSLPSRPLCGVDGAVNTTTIEGLRDIGVDIVYPGSALVGGEDVKKAYEQLKQSYGR